MDHLTHPLPLYSTSTVHGSIHRSNDDPRLKDFRTQPRICTDPCTVPGMWCKMWLSSSRQLLDVSLDFSSHFQNPLVCHHSYSADVETAGSVTGGGELTLLIFYTQKMKAQSTAESFYWIYLILLNLSLMLYDALLFNLVYSLCKALSTAFVENCTE